MSKDGEFLYTERIEMTTESEEDQTETNTTDTASNVDYPKADKPLIQLFTMTYCPYGNQAEDMVYPVYELLGDSIDFEPHYVIYNESFGYQGSEYCLDEENQYCSMHGIQELNQGVRELCTYKYQKDKFWDFVLEANVKCDSSNVDTCWESVASNLGMDVDQIKTCEANEAYELLGKEVALNTEYGVTGSPATFINGTEYAGSRSPEAFKQAVCSSFNNPPESCNEALEATTSTTDSGSCN